MILTSFLKNILITSCFNYKTEQEFRLEMDKRLIIRYRIIPRRYLNNIYVEFNFCLPDPKKIKYDIVIMCIKVIIHII